MKRCVCILQGLTDLPLDDLGGVTPLQKASCPNLDGFAQSGAFFSVEPAVTGGIEASLTSILSGNDVTTPVNTGLFQAYASGLAVDDTKEAFLIRFVAIGQDTIVDVSDSLVSNEEGKILCDYLTEALHNTKGVVIHHLAGPQALLLYDTGVTADPEPCFHYNPIRSVGDHWLSPLDNFPAEKAASLTGVLRKIASLVAAHEINRLRYDLEEEVVNGVFLCQSGGVFREIAEHTPDDKDSKILYSPSLISIGIAKTLGIDVLSLPPEHKKYSHIPTILARLDNIISRKDTFFMEFQYLWASTFKGDLLEKVKTIEYLDRYLLGPLGDYCSTNNCTITVLPLRNSDIRKGEWQDGAVPAVSFPAQKLGSSASFHDIAPLHEAHMPLHNLL